MKLLGSLILALVFLSGALPRIDVNGRYDENHTQKSPLAVNAHHSGHQLRASRRTIPVQLWLLSMLTSDLRFAGSLTLHGLEPVTASSNHILLAILCRLRL